MLIETHHGEPRLVKRRADILHKFLFLVTAVEQNKHRHRLGGLYRQRHNGRHTFARLRLKFNPLTAIMGRQGIMERLHRTVHKGRFFRYGIQRVLRRVPVIKVLVRKILEKRQRHNGDQYKYNESD